MLAVVGVPSREARPPGSGEDTLSQELRTVRLLRPHVLVGFRWSHTGLCPGCKSSHNKYIRSFVSQLPQIRTCALNASGSSRCGFAVPHTTHPLCGDTLGGSMPSAWFWPLVHNAAPPWLHGVREGPFPRFHATMECCD